MYVFIVALDLDDAVDCHADIDVDARLLLDVKIHLHVDVDTSACVETLSVAPFSDGDVFF